MHRRRLSLVLAVALVSPLVVHATAPVSAAAAPNPLKLVLWKTVGRNISPKSVVASGHGYVIGQNMMYTHGVSVYNANGRMVKRISDSLPRSMLGLKGTGDVQGSPVEAAFSPDGRFAYVSNYQMYGSGFNAPGFDKCSGSAKYDRSWLYKINMTTLSVVGTVRVGETPKYVAMSPDGKWILVTNWCSFDLTVIDATTFLVAKTIDLGRYPRGIAFMPDSSKAWITVMGAAKLALLDMATLKTKFRSSAASTPRHVVVSPDGTTLYVSHNLSSVVTKQDARTGKVYRRITTGTEPRSMVLSPDGTALYVVNYVSNTLSVVSTKTMKVVQTLHTGSHPVGVTFEPTKGRVWVACYAGLIQIYRMSGGA